LVAGHHLPLAEKFFFSSAPAPRRNESIMTKSKYLILGGGMVAGYAAQELVKQGLKPGELTIVSADSAPPYERPPLSKGFLAGRDDEAKIWINPEEFYASRGIELLLGTEVGGVDAQRRVMRMRSGAERAFDKLVIATGARPRTLDVPGSGLETVQYLRSLEDSRRIRARAEGVKRAVVVGSGFIAIEVTSVLAQRGVEVTMLVRDDRVWKNVFTPPMSQSFENYFSKRGVRFLKHAGVREIRNKDDATTVALESGQRIQCDLVVAGIGVLPETEVLPDSGIRLGDGVIVNPYLETNVPGIYAAGDVANYEDVLFAKRRRVEHWDNAVEQGRHCARALSGDRQVFRHVPYFFSDVFDLSYELWGDMTGADEVVDRGDLASSSFSVWWLKEHRLVAAFTMNRPDEEREAAPRLIEAKTRLTAVDLPDGRWPAV
jgi:NADPH-dependent 2,4-dienoyl-CoA reductase/sulfur reductase-like enzyme